MREIVLDTETTGLSPADGHRLVEIGAVELLNHLPTGKTFQLYLNPERDMPKEAEAVHGLSSSFLKDKPKFKAKAGEFLDFIEDSPLIIHNASFDMGFINAELTSIGLAQIGTERVIDTLQLARRRYPMGPNSLDALCRRYGIDNTKRTKHGALMDAELLAEVYLALTRGQESLVMDLDEPSAAQTAAALVDAKKLSVLRATDEEIKAHEKILDAIDKAAKENGGSLWRKLAG